MTIYSAQQACGTDAYSQLVSGLRMEFGCDDVDAIADRIIESEAADFHWEARVKERYLGQHFELEFAGSEVDEELSRVAILSFLADRWHVGVCLIDGEGLPVEMLWIRPFESRVEAEIGFFEAR